MIIWLEKDLVLAIHDRQLSEHGGKPGLRDSSESVRPKASRAKASPGGKWRKSGVYTRVHEHFEPLSNEGLASAAALERTVARPQQLYAYGDPLPDLADLAASLAFGLARNHPFVDGNKRSAHVSYRVFLALNGADLVATDESKFISILALAEGKLKEKEFAAWLRAHIKTEPRDEVHEPATQYKAKPKKKKRAAK